MLSLPAFPAPNGATPALVDRGGVLRGASALRVNRLGSHYRIAVSYPPLDDDAGARVFVSRLIRAKSTGLRMPFPLLSVVQTVFGVPVVDGAGQAGGTLAVRGLGPRTVVREGYWASIEDADGQHYLHNIGSGVIADADGRATLDVSDTMLRCPFVDGARVHLITPMIEGLIAGNEFEWRLAVDHNTGIEFEIEEAA